MDLIAYQMTTINAYVTNVEKLQKQAP